MAKKDMKSALKGSLQMEDQSVKQRFEKAEILLGKQEREVTTKKDRDLISTSTEEPEEKPLAEPKVIRDSFTMPQSDYDLITRLKKRALQNSVEITKSEILRAGIQALEMMRDGEFLTQLSKVEKLKTGRPKYKE